jgi:hypothetical protein
MLPQRDYGAGNMERSTGIQINSIDLSADGKSVFLQINPEQFYRDGKLQMNTVVEIKLTGNIKSGGQPARTPGAWYTLNAISASEAFDINGCTDSRYKNYNQEATFDDGTCKGLVADVDLRYNPAETPFGEIKPSDNTIAVSVRGGGPHSVRVISLDGKLVSHERGVGRRSYSFSNLKKLLIYVIDVRTAENNFTQKVALF